MKIYDTNGYLNMPEIMEQDNPFTFIVGARGIGKTYGTLQELIKNRKKFILIRTTEDEAIMCSNEVGNPFKKLNKNNKWDIRIKTINKHIWGIYNGEDPEYIGMIIALTCFSKVRGLDLSDVEVAFYDEFISEKIQKRVPALGESLMNAYETINRNRELEGEKPLKLICASNSMDITNDILVKWGLVSMIQKIKKMNNEYMVDRKTNILLVYPEHSTISEQKKQTVLYQISKRYNEMALSNDFREFYEKNIKSEDIRHYKVFAKYDNMYFYRNTSGYGYYITDYLSGRLCAADCYNNTDYERTVFCRRFPILTDSYFHGRIIFERAELEIDFLNLFKLT